MISQTMQRLLQFVATWIKTYQQAYERSNPPAIYRIIEIKKNSKHDVILTIQIIGKAVVFHYSPLDILKDNQLLESFSKQDVRTITWLAQQEVTRPKYAVTSQKMVGDQAIFKLQKLGNDEHMEKKAGEISLDRELIESLGPKDAHMIGYMSAQEKTLSDIHIMKHGHER